MNENFTKEEHEEFLEEQIFFLKNSVDGFDKGNLIEAKRIATSIRVILHDTQSSTSILKHLNRKDIDFYDTADPYDNRTIASHCGLLAMDNTNFYPRLEFASPRLVKFNEWWNGIILVDQNKCFVSRKDLVLTYANKLGGAHVDHSLQAVYSDILKGRSMGWWIVEKDGEPLPSSEFGPHSMRQIAHELLRTLDPDYKASRVDEAYFTDVKLLQIDEDTKGFAYGPKDNPIKQDKPVK